VAESIPTPDARLVALIADTMWGADDIEPDWMMPYALRLAAALGKKVTLNDDLEQVGWLREGIRRGWELVPDADFDDVSHMTNEGWVPVFRRKDRA